MPQLVYKCTTCVEHFSMFQTTPETISRPSPKVRYIWEPRELYFFSAYKVEIPLETENITRRETTLLNEYKNQKNLLINLLCNHISNNAHELQRQFTVEITVFWVMSEGGTLDSIGTNIIDNINKEKWTQSLILTSTD